MAAVQAVSLASGLGGGGVGAGFGSNGSAGAYAAADAGESAPAVTLSFSQDALSLLAQTSNVRPLTSTVQAVNAVSNVAGLSEELLKAAILAAALERDKDEADESSNNIASAMVVAAAVQAYMQVSSLPGASVVTTVPGAGLSVQVSLPAAA